LTISYVHLDVPSKSLDAQIHAEVLPKQQIQGKPASLAMASSANATPLGGCGAFAGDYGDYGESYGGGAAGGFPANGGMMVPPKMQFPPKVAWSKSGMSNVGRSRWMFPKIVVPPNHPF